MDTIAVAPMGSAVAPAAIAERGSQQRRQHKDAEDDQEPDRAASGKPTEARITAMPTANAESPMRDDEGHIDCYG